MKTGTKEVHVAGNKTSVDQRSSLMGGAVVNCLTIF